jgi:hypothetical protein
MVPTQAVPKMPSMSDPVPVQKPEEPVELTEEQMKEREKEAEIR